MLDRKLARSRREVHSIGMLGGKHLLNLGTQSQVKSVLFIQPTITNQNAEDAVRKKVLAWKNMEEITGRGPTDSLVWNRPTKTQS